MQHDRGALIISFDCEGKWGVADKINEHHVRAFTNKNLNGTYQRLVDLLDTYGLKATFAFVGAFVMSLEEYRQHSDWFRDVAVAGTNWLGRFKKDVDLGCCDGWLNPEALSIVRSAERHEIGSHGFTHLPLSESIITRQDFRREMEGVRNVAALKQIPFRTLVYPRNDTGYADELHSCGIVGYRERLLKPAAKFAAARNILREFNVLQSAHAARPADQVVRIPPGYFLNWRTGGRKRIPVAVTVQRWTHLISDAAKTGRVVHLWSHPWNFLDGRRQFELFERILQVAARYVSRGKLDNLTQLDFCRQVDRQIQPAKSDRIAA